MAPRHRETEPKNSAHRRSHKDLLASAHHRNRQLTGGQTHHLPHRPTAPPPHREYPPQSAKYRMWGPGFLDVPLVPEEQEPATPTGTPTQARFTKTMNLDAIARLQADELQKLIESLQGVASDRQEPTRQPPMQTATALTEDEIQWEQLSSGHKHANLICGCGSANH